MYSTLLGRVDWVAMISKFANVSKVLNLPKANLILAQIWQTTYVTETQVSVEDIDVSYMYVIQK